MRERRAGSDLFAEGVGNRLGIFDNRLPERLRALRGRMQARGFEDGREHCEVEAGHVLRAAELFPALSRKEPARTVCEHSDWRAGSGEDSVHAGLKLLETLESQGVAALPAKRHERKLRGALRAPDRTAAGEPGERLECGLSELGGVSLEAAQSAHSAIVAPARSLGNFAEQAVGACADDGAAVQANFKNALATVARQLEAAVLGHARLAAEAVSNIVEGIASCISKTRPGRSYPRVSKCPDDRFRNPNRKSGKAALPAAWRRRCRRSGAPS